MGDCENEKPDEPPPEERPDEEPEQDSVRPDAEDDVWTNAAEHGDDLVIGESRPLFEDDEE